MLRKIFNAIKRILQPVGKIISTIVNFILLSIVYLVGVGLTSIIAKLFGNHFLDLKPKKASNWIEHKITKESIEKYYRMF